MMHFSKALRFGQCRLSINHVYIEHGRYFNLSGVQLSRGASMTNANDPQEIVSASTILDSHEDAPPERHVGVVLFEGCDGAGIAVFAEAFETAYQLAEKSSMRRRWQVHFLSTHGGLVATRASLRVLTVAVNTAMFCGYDFVLVASGEEQGTAHSRGALEAWLQRLKRNAIPVMDLRQSADCGRSSLHPITVDTALDAALRLIAYYESDVLAARVGTYLYTTR